MNSISFFFSVFLTKPNPVEPKSNERRDYARVMSNWEFMLNNFICYLCFFVVVYFFCSVRQIDNERKILRSFQFEFHFKIRPKNFGLAPHNWPNRWRYHSPIELNFNKFQFYLFLVSSLSQVKRSFHLFMFTITFRVWRSESIELFHERRCRLCWQQHEKHTKTQHHSDCIRHFCNRNWLLRSLKHETRMHYSIFKWNLCFSFVFLWMNSFVNKTNFSDTLKSTERRSQKETRVCSNKSLLDANQMSTKKEWVFDCAMTRENERENRVMKKWNTIAIASVLKIRE